jgi:N-acetylglucosaminyl-diphospho-decaprenol L-rhamnosyltransferase
MATPVALPTLDIVIVNWNTGGQLQACLRSVAAADRTGFELRQVVVVDNASDDHSATSLDPSGLPLTVIPNGTNRGFAAACNQGAEHATSDYVLFLNPDTELFASSLTTPVCQMQSRGFEDVGICGIRLVDAKGAPAISCARFPTLGNLASQVLGLSRMWSSRFPPHFMSPAECAMTREVDQIIGAFFLVRRQVLRDLGGFDERFFLYYEEVDFSLRARLRGYRSMYLAEAEARHHGGGSSGQVRAMRLFYSLRSRLLYGFKNYRRPSAWALVFLTVLIEPWTRIAWGLVRVSPGELSETVRAYAMLAAYGVGRRLRQS